MKRKKKKKKPKVGKRNSKKKKQDEEVEVKKKRKRSKSRRKQEVLLTKAVSNLIERELLSAFRNPYRVAGYGLNSHWDLWLLGIRVQIVGLWCTRLFHYLCPLNHLPVRLFIHVGKCETLCFLFV